MLHSKKHPLPGIRSWIPLLVLLVLFAFAASARAAADLPELIEKYRSAARGVSGTPEARANEVREKVAPILAEIGKLDTEDSLAFLVGELRQQRNPPEVAAACAAPILASSNERAAALALADFSSRHPDVQRALLDAVAKTERDVSGGSRELLAAPRVSLRPEVVLALPAALARLDSIDAVKAILAAVPSSSRRRGDRDGGESGEYVDAAIEALAKMKNDAVRRWIATDGLERGLRMAGAGEICLGVVERLRLADARDAVVKALSHRDPDVSARAISALVAIGVGGEARAIRRAIERQHRSSGLDFKVRALDALAASGEGEAIASVIEIAQGSDPELRAIAMGSLALVAEKSAPALRALTDGLADREPSVRAVALRSLSRVRHKGMIGPLIGALDEDNPHAFRVNALKLLIRVTGQNMGLVVADWQKWWQLAEARFELPKDGEKEFTSVRAYDLDYFGIEIASKRLTFVVDISSSMTAEVPVKRRAEPEDEDDEGSGRTRVAPKDPGGEEDGKLGDSARKIDILKVELARVIRKLTGDTSINIVCFDAQFKPWQKELQPLAGRGRDKALDYVRSINTGHGTNVFDSLEHALKDERVDTIYLMTDGQPTRGRLTDPDAIVAEIGRQNRLRGVTIHCIAFGEESDLLKRLAAENGGDYRFVNEY